MRSSVIAVVEMLKEEVLRTHQMVQIMILVAKVKQMTQRNLLFVQKVKTPCLPIPA